MNKGTVPHVEKKIRLHRCSLMKGDMFMNDDRNSKYDITEDGRKVRVHDGKRGIHGYPIA